MCVSSDAAALSATCVYNVSQSSAGSIPSVDVGVDVEVEADHASHCRRSVWTLLQDHRMLAHDGGKGRPLRYMSLYGGIVAKLL